MEDKKHIVIFACITALCLVGDSMLYVVLPVHYESAGLTSLWQVGVILAVNRIVRLPLNPCIGFIYRHISERTGVLVAVALSIATTLSYGFIDGFVWWILARCVWGLAWTLLRLGSLFCILKISTPLNRGQLTGLYNGLFRLGSLVGMLCGGILADAFGLEITACVLAALGCLAAILAILYIPAGKAEGEECQSNTSILAGLSLITRERQVFWLVITGALVALALQGVVASTLSRLIDVHTGGEIMLLGATLGAATLAGVFQALRWGWEPWLAPVIGRASDQRYGWRRMFTYTLLIGAFFFAAVSAPLPLSIWFICILGLQLSATALNTISEAAAASTAAKSGGRTLLMHYALFVDVGAAAGPLVAYGMNALLGINAVYLFSTGLFVALALVWLVLPVKPAPA